MFSATDFAHQTLVQRNNTIKNCLPKRLVHYNLAEWGFPDTGLIN